MNTVNQVSGFSVQSFISDDPNESSKDCDCFYLLICLFINRVSNVLKAAKKEKKNSYIVEDDQELPFILELLFIL